MCWRGLTHALEGEWQMLPPTYLFPDVLKAAALRGLEFNYTSCVRILTSYVRRPGHQVRLKSEKGGWCTPLLGLMQGWLVQGWGLMQGFSRISQERVGRAGWNWTQLYVHFFTPTLNILGLGQVRSRSYDVIQYVMFGRNRRILWSIVSGRVALLSGVGFCIAGSIIGVYHVDS